MMNQQLDIRLRQTEISDLEILFLFQLDQQACYQAAFTPEDQGDKPAYLAKFTKLLREPTVNNKTIIVDDTIVGSIAKFEMNGNAEITYWIDRSFWGQGIGTKALTNFLSMEATRPIFGRVAFDNFPSQKMMEKCGFVRVDTDRGFANSRQQEIEEFIYQLV